MTLDYSAFQISENALIELFSFLEPGGYVDITNPPKSIRGIAAKASLSIVSILEDRVLLKSPGLGTIFEQDTVLGVFTHREQPYLPILRKSVAELFPNVLYIELVQSGMINKNMEALRQLFIQTGKRYWIFLDDDIKFLHPNTINNAIQYLVTDKHGIVSVYSTFNPETTVIPSEYQSRQTTWATGYFIAVDSYKLDDIIPDQNLPHGNTSVDTSYSAECLCRGLTIGIANELVYHVKKDTLVYWDIVDETNKYLMQKWGNFYFNNIVYDGNVLEWK